MASGVVWPGENARPVEHLRYLLGAADRVAETRPPAGYHYAQIPHGEGQVIGDPSKPAMLNASYKFHGRSIVSLSVPEFSPLGKDYHFNTDEKGNILDVKRGTGLTGTNLADSLTALLKANGIETDGTKVGHDKLSRTVYVEMNVTNKGDYERAKAIVDEVVTGRGKNPSQLFAQMQTESKNLSHMAGRGGSLLSDLEVIPSNKGPYISVEGMGADQLSSLKKSLAEHGVAFTEKKTSLGGGMNVLAIPAEDSGKLDQFLSQRSKNQGVETKPPVASLPAERDIPKGRKWFGGGLVAAAAAVFSGAGAAAEPAATPISVADAAVNSAVPGWRAVRQGRLCEAFGEVTGAVAAGGVAVAGTGATVTAAAVSGPAAPAVGVVGAVLVTGAVIATEDVVRTSAADACKRVSSKLSP